MGIVPHDVPMSANPEVKPNWPQPDPLVRSNRPGRRSPRENWSREFPKCYWEYAELTAENPRPFFATKPEFSLIDS